MVDGLLYRRRAILIVQTWHFHAYAYIPILGAGHISIHLISSHLITYVKLLCCTVYYFKYLLCGVASQFQKSLG